VFRTAKGDIAIEAMKFCANSILGRYIKLLRDQFSDQSLNIFLIADNCGTHTNRNILTLLQRTDFIPIWLPPHSSHFLQLLDVAIFGSFKKHCGNQQRSEVKPQLEGEILRVLHAWHNATYGGYIAAG
jgi:hypothetical protein